MSARQVILALVLACGSCATAQYAIDWYTIDGGGGTSTGGVYSVSGTIGQPDTGKLMTAGGFSLTGGFWAVYAVQTEGAPYLSIVVSGESTATVSWVPEPNGWILQETSGLTSSSWTNSPSGATNPVVVPATVPVKFYRLFKP